MTYRSDSSPLGQRRPLSNEIIDRRHTHHDLRRLLFYIVLVTSTLAIISMGAHMQNYADRRTRHTRVSQVRNRKANVELVLEANEGGQLATDEPARTEATKPSEDQASRSVSSTWCKDFLESKENLPSGVWTWHHHAGEPSSTLVAHHSGPSGDYAKMLEITSSVGQAYARHWQYDFVTFRGIYYGCLEWHSAYNKLGVLQEARKRGYETVLLMDADAMVYNFSIPVNETISSQDMLVHGQNAGKKRWALNNGVMTWNLKHPKFDVVLDKWKESSLLSLRQSARGEENVHMDDQTKLHHVLRDSLTDSEQEISIENSTSFFLYRRGTFVKHFIRKKHNNKLGWDSKSSATARVQELEKCAKDVCEHFPSHCSGL